MIRNVYEVITWWNYGFGIASMKCINMANALCVFMQDLIYLRWTNT